MGLVDLPGVAVQYHQELVGVINVNDILMLPTVQVVRKQKVAKTSVWKQIIDVAKIHGYERLKEEQLLAVQQFVSGKMSVSLPTGFSKSLIYGILPAIYVGYEGTQCRRWWV